MTTSTHTLDCKFFGTGVCTPNCMSVSASGNVNLVAALRDTIAAKDAAIAALKESNAFVTKMLLEQIADLKQQLKEYVDVSDACRH